MSDEIEIYLGQHVGPKIKWERDNEGCRERVTPYRKRWSSAKFRLPSGKKKNEIFPYEFSGEEILAAVSKKYSNFKFKIKTLNHDVNI